MRRFSRRFSGADACALGIVLLATSLIERHIDRLHGDVMISLTSWAGSILVVVGLGLILFLED